MKNIVFNIDRMELLKKYPDKYFDWAIDDPPYFSGPEKRQFYGLGVSKSNVNRVQYPVTVKWEVPGKEYFDELIRVSKNQIIWGCNYYRYLFGSGRIVWNKVNGDTSFSSCEIAYCSAHDSVRLFNYMWNGMMQGKSLSEGHVPIGNKALNEVRIHQTQKPLALYRWIYQKYVPTGSKVIDCHTGSGSNRIIAYEHKCEFVGAELNLEHFNNQEVRYQQHVRQWKNQYKIL